MTLKHFKAIYNLIKPGYFLYFDSGGYRHFFIITKVTDNIIWYNNIGILGDIQSNYLSNKNLYNCGEFDKILKPTISNIIYLLERKLSNSYAEKYLLNLLLFKEFNESEKLLVLNYLKEIF